jgi:hypothetical protein
MRTAMTCAFSRETLALYVEHDLPDGARDLTSRHLESCRECEQLVEELRASQLFLKTLRRETVSSAECVEMRRGVMTAIAHAIVKPPLPLIIDGLLFGAWRRPYALACVTVLAVALFAVVGQQRHATADMKPSALFETGGVLRQPEGYRDWLAIERDGSSATHPSAHAVYINPFGYREYLKTGKFPDGTMMVLESASGLLASVKDSARFAGGWGFFDFTSPAGGAAPHARAASEADGCRACHRHDAASDHVFTQFYPLLRAAPVVSRSTGSTISPVFLLSGRALDARSSC